jgi:hypothetical protein
VADIFREIDEDVRHEQYKKLWDRYQNYIIAGVLLIILGVAGWRGYQWWEAKNAAKTGTAFNAAMTLSAEAKHAQAQVAFAKIAKDGTSGYRDLARLQAAAELAQHDPKAAVQAYDAIAADQSLSGALRDLAGVRAGALLVDSAPYAELRKRLEPLTAADRPYRHTARELLALSAWRGGDAAEVRKWANLINSDMATPPDMRQRMAMLLALIAENGNG